MPSSSKKNSQFIRTVDWLGYSVTIFQVCGHLEGVNVHVGRLAQSHEFPQRHSKGPLGKEQEHNEGTFKTTVRGPVPTASYSTKKQQLNSCFRKVKCYLQKEVYHTQLVSLAKIKKSAFNINNINSK